MTGAAVPARGRDGTFLRCIRAAVRGMRYLPVPVLFFIAPLLLMKGFYITGFIIATLSLAADFALYSSAVLPMEKGRRKLIAAALMIEHVIVVAMAVYYLAQPDVGGWTRLPGTAEWSDPVLVSLGDGRFAALVTENDDRKLLVTGDLGKTWKDTWYHGGAGRSIHCLKDRGEIWVVPESFTVVQRFSIANWEWDRFVRPPGEHMATAMGAGRFYLATGGRLYTYLRELNMWQLFTKAGFPVLSVAVSPDRNAPLTIIAGAEWMESGPDENWRYVKPKDAKVTAPRAAAGGGGWRYVYEGGVLSGTLFAAAPGKGFEKREFPVPDVLVFEANPADGKELWIGSGGGVSRSLDGGATWHSIGLAQIQVGALAVDFEKKIVLAGSSNLLFRKGIYMLQYGR